MGAAVWYYRAPHGGSPAAITSVIPRNEDRWLDDLQSRSPKDVERGTADLGQRRDVARGPAHLEQRATAALPVIRRTLQDANADAAKRRAALKAAAILGPRAVEAIPDVADALDDPEYAPEAALALSFMGSAAMPTLREAVKADAPAVRRA